MADDLLKNTPLSATGSARSPSPPTRSPTAPRGLMEEVATSKVTGEEEYWSHTDLWDFAANVKGARAAFEDVRPILAKRDPALEKTLDRPVRRHRRAAGPAPSRRRLRPLHRAQPGRGQAARRRGQRPVGAAVAPDRGRAALTHLSEGATIPELNVSRRGLIGGAAGVAGVAAGFAVGARYGDDRAESDGTTATGPRRRTPSAASTRPASSRRPRTGCTSPRSTSRPRSRDELVALLKAWTDRRRADDPGPAGGSGRPDRGRPAGAPRTTPARPSGCRPAG